MIEVYRDYETIDKMPWYWTSRGDYDGELEEFAIGSQLFAQMMGWA